MHQHLKISKRHLVFLLFCFIYRLTLEYAYSTIISKRFSYLGYDLDFNLVNYVNSWLLFLTIIFILKSKFHKVSDFFYFTSIVALLIPMYVLYGLDNNLSIYPPVVSTISILIIYIITNLKSFKISWKYRMLDGVKIFEVISILSILFLIYLYRNAALNLNFADVYYFREENSKLTEGTFISYISSWSYQIFTIALMAVSLHLRRYWMVLLIIFIQVFFYAASGHKSILFYPLLVFFIRWLNRYTNLGLVALQGHLIAIIFPILTFILFEDILVSSYLLRRVIFIPAKLTFIYFEFFESKPFIFWSNSILSSVLEYPFSERHTVLISEYAGWGDASANNGYISSGYAQAGLFGVLIYTLILAIILKLIDSISGKQFPLWLGISLTIVSFRSIVLSSDLFTVFLTHGLIIIMLIFFLLSKNLTKNT